MHGQQNIKKKNNLKYFLFSNNNNTPITKSIIFFRPNSIFNCNESK